VITSTFDLSSRLLTALTSLGFSTYTYSANGNLTGINEHAGHTTMAYDFEKLLSVHENCGTITSSLLNYV
jgi:YD repeat-containing protein